MTETRETIVTGTGLCAEAQADGVPCVELGRDCPTCERAVRAVAQPDGDCSDGAPGQPERPSS